MRFSKFIFAGTGKETKFTFHLILAVFLTFGLTLSLGHLLADWQPPAVSPPGGNLAKPIYSSSTVTQYITPIAPAAYADLMISGGLSIRDSGYFGDGLQIYNGPLLVGNDASLYIGWSSIPLVDIGGGPVHIQDNGTTLGLLLGGNGARIQAVDTTNNPPLNINLLLNPDGGNVGIGVDPTWKLQVNAAGGNGILSSGGVAGVNGQGSSYGVYGLDTNNNTYGYLGNGNYGVYGNSSVYGVVGQGGTNGVVGNGSTNGVVGNGANGVAGIGTTRGVYGCYTSSCTHWGRLGVKKYGVTADSYGGGGCDLAENYALAGDAPDLEAGDIVSLDERKEVAIKRSDSAYDVNVIGVVSTAPSITMNVEDDLDGNNYPIAMIGRVPTKVTTENGPIHIGDLIISSSKPGYGMRCDDYAKCQGAIVGKALENFSGGEGKIEILIKTGF